MAAPKRNLNELAISESGLIFDPVTGTISTSNATGVLILRELCAGKSSEQLRDKLLAEYGVEREVVERDLQEFLSQLRGYGFIYE